MSSDTFIRRGLPTLSALDLEKNISVEEAAEIKGISPDGIRRYYGHLLRRPSPRRTTIRLGDLLNSEPVDGVE